MRVRGDSARAAALVEHLRQVAEALISLVGSIEPEQWTRVPRPGVWSPGKDAEHVADGAAYHQWIIRTSLGEKVPPRPKIERSELTSQRRQPDVVDLLRQWTDACIALVASLSDEQLDLPVRPARAHLATLEQMIEAMLIGHYESHRREIEAKLQAPEPLLRVERRNLPTIPAKRDSVEQDLGTNRLETCRQKCAQ
jgi:hypothetical protein